MNINYSLADPSHRTKIFTIPKKSKNYYLTWVPNGSLSVTQVTEHSNQLVHSVYNGVSIVSSKANVHVTFSGKSTNILFMHLAFAYKTAFFVHFLSNYSRFLNSESQRSSFLHLKCSKRFFDFCFTTFNSFILFEAKCKTLCL